MKISTEEICGLFPDLVIEVRGKHVTLQAIAPTNQYDKQDMVFLSSKEPVEDLVTEPPGAVVTDAEIAEELGDGLACPVLIVKDVRLAQALIRQEFDDYLFRDEEWEAIHPSAIIHDSATLGTDVVIGPGVIIGARCNIGSSTIIRANSVIEHDAIIGENSVIHSLVNIGYACRIGSRVIIKPGTTIGAEGFGLARDENHTHHRIPQTGNVILEDDVMLGSNCNVDRGTFGSTIIRRRCKVDAQCHIAHNCDIGEDTIIVAQCGISGSSIIGKRVMFSGQSATLDHKTVGDDLVFVHRSGVGKDMMTPGIYGGTPAEPLKEYVRRLATPRKVTRLEKRIRELEARLNKLES